MADAQDPLCPKPFRPFRRVSIDPSRHFDICRPPRAPAQHQGYRYPTTLPASPPDTGSSPTYISQSPQIWRQPIQETSPPHSTSSETYIDPSPQRSHSTGTHININSSHTYVDPSHSSSNGIYIESSSQKSISGRRFAYKSPQLSHSSNQHASSSARASVDSESQPEVHVHTHPSQTIISASPPLQHNGVPYTDSPPHGYGIHHQPPYTPITPSYPASSGTTTTNLSQLSPWSTARPSTASIPTPPILHHRQYDLHQQPHNTIIHPQPHPHPPQPLPAHAYPPPRPPQHPSPEHFPPVCTGLYRTYPVPITKTATTTTTSPTRHARFFPSDSEGTSSSGGRVSITSSISNPGRHLPRRERRRRAQAAAAACWGGKVAGADAGATMTAICSSTSSSPLSSDAQSDSEFEEDGGRRPRQGAKRVEKGSVRVRKDRKKNDDDDDDDDDEEEEEEEEEEGELPLDSGDEAERQVKAHERREAKRRKYKRKLDELRGERERECRMDRKYDTWPAMLDLAAFFATYVLM